jgi:hypothetical protein
VQLGAFGGLADGKLTSLGASVGNLGQWVPLADGVYLDHISFGLCLNPPPFKIRANVGANFLGSKNLVAVDGGFTYTDGSGFNPWSLELDGDVSVATIPIGHGTFGVNGFGVFDFSLGAGVDILNGAASLNAQVDGWIDGRNGNFVVGGEGQVCLQGVGCLLKAEGEVSTVGIAGCLTIGFSSPGIDLVIPLDGGSPHLGGPSEPITAGFGYDWGASTFQLLGGSCDFTAYEPTYPVASVARAAQASAGYRLSIAPDTKAVALRIHGTNGPPRVVLRGPHGAAITQPTSGGVLRRGHYLIAENKTNGTTNVVLVRPAAGVWTVSPVPGSSSSPTKIDRASVTVPPTFATHIRAKRGLRVLQVAYAVPNGTTVRLLERSKGVTRTLAARLRGRTGRHASRTGGRDARGHPDPAEEHRLLPRSSPDAALPGRGAPRPAWQGQSHARLFAVAGRVTVFRVSHACRRARARLRRRSRLSRAADPERSLWGRGHVQGRRRALRLGVRPRKQARDQGERAVGWPHEQKAAAGQGLHLSGVLP